MEKIVFVASLTILAYLVGFATNTFGWFPSRLLEEAWLQGQFVGSQVSDPPAFLAPRVYDRTGARLVESGAEQPGLTLVATSWNHDGWEPGLRLIDSRGHVLHQWEVHPAEIFSDWSEHTLSWSDPDIQGTYLFRTGDVLINVEYVGTARLDPCGRVRWQVRERGHHSIARADDGSFWIPGVTDKVPAAGPDYPGGYPGVDGRLYKDLLLQVSADGDVIREIPVLDLVYANGLERHIAKSQQLNSADITHLNDIEPLSASLADEYPLFDAGDLLVSLKGFDLVLVVDPDAERVKWHASHPFIKQHDPDFMGDGWIGVFDNNRDRTERGTMLGGSRIVAVQPHTDSTRVLFPTSDSDPFYTTYRGKWQQLSNGNLLLTEAKPGRVVEVAPDGSTVWEWIADPYDDSLVPEVSEGTRYDLTPAEVAEWPCSPDEDFSNEQEPGS